MPATDLRPMVAADIEPASVAMAADDWGDRRTWFTFAVGSSACHPFVIVDRDGDIAGSGVATINGTVGWIGTIWVRSDLRRRGLGRALTEVTIDAAEAHGCRTLVLVSTDQGRPLYEGLGFEVETWYRTMEAPDVPPDAAPASGSDGSSAVRAATTADLDDIASGTELARIPVTRRVVHGAAVSSDDRYAFISQEGVGSEPGAVDVIDLRALKKVAAIDVGQQAGGIDFWKVAPSRP